MNRAEYINEYKEIYQSLGKRGSGDGLVDKADRIRSLGYNDDCFLLDYGCGWGAILGGINPRKYIGVDIVPEAIRIAKEQFPGRDFDVLSIGELKITEVDFAISLSVFTHALYSDVPICLNDISRHLKKGGIAIIDILEGDIPETSHVRYWNRIEFEKELSNASLKVTESKKYTSSVGYTHTYLKCVKI